MNKMKSKQMNRLIKKLKKKSYYYFFPKFSKISKMAQKKLKIRIWKIDKKREIWTNKQVTEETFFFF